MPDKTGKTGSDPLVDKVIDDLYDVAMNPLRFEQLLDHWEALIAGPREAANTDIIPRETLSSFETHFERASRALRTLKLRDGEDAASGLLAEIERSAAFAVGPSMRLTHVNAAAASAFGLAPGAEIGSLPLDEADAGQLRSQLAHVLRSNADEPAILRLSSVKTGRTLVVLLRQVRPYSGAPFVLVVTSEVGWPENFDNVLSETFDLTPAEFQVAQSLAEGLSLQEIALDRGRSIATIRDQVKTLLSKTGTRNQAELVRLTLSSLEIAQYSRGLQDAGSDRPRIYRTLEPRPFETMTHTDGRRQDYLILGDPEGRPCLYYPLDYGLVRWPASAEREALKRGLRVVVPVRPGYGKSTPLPKTATYIGQLSADVAALLDHLGIERAAILTLGSDSLLAIDFHAACPERVGGLICCAGVLPASRAEHYDRMEKWHRFILAGAKYTPHLLPFMVKAGFALANRLGKRAFVNAVYGDSEADKATFAIPEVFEALTLGSEVCLSADHSAHDAFAREVIAKETSDWTSRLDALRAAATRRTDPLPVRFFNGLQDPEVPALTLEEHRVAHDWIDFTVYPDAGQLVFFLKWRDILGALDRMA